MTPAVSILIPSYRAEATIARAVASVIAQTETDWECILASDDGVDYLDILNKAGIRDPRLRQVFTGGIGTGSASPRNAALAQARGAYIASLDADDAFEPERLEALLPLARDGGAATDNTAVHDDSGRLFKRPFPDATAPFPLDVADLLGPRVPFQPLFRAELKGDGWRSVPFAADLMFNLELLSRSDRFFCHADSFYLYYKTRGSITHSADTADRADIGYDRLLAILRDPEHPIDDSIRRAAIEEFAANKRLNRVFRRYLAEQRCTDLEDFLLQTDNGQALPEDEMQR